MRKHLYFHSSNLECTRQLKDDSLFQPAYMYSDVNLFQNEYGRIRTPDTYFHLLLGNVPQKGCPWCKGKTKIVKINKPDPYDLLAYSEYCTQCFGCGARGPVIKVNPQIEDDQRAMKELFDLMNKRFAHRRAWDENFVNPYEGE